MALAGLDRRNISKGSHLVGVAKSINRKTRGNLRFELDEDEELLQPPRLDESDEEDELLAYAIQESMESGFAKGKSPSTPHGKTPPDPPHASTSQKEATPEDDFYTDYPPPGRLEWALAFANSGPNRSHSTPSKTPTSSLFGKPSLLASPTQTLPPKPAEVSDPHDDMEEVQLALPVSKEPALRQNPASPLTTSEVEQNNLKSPSSFTDPSPTISFVPSATLLRSPEKPRAIAEPPPDFFDSDEEMEEVPVNLLLTDTPPVQIDFQAASTSKFPTPPRLDLGNLGTRHSTLMTSPTTPPLENQEEGETEERLFAWSRTPSPSLEIDEGHPSPPAEEWDAADEIDVQAEEGEFARFMSQMKGKTLDDVRDEIDDEIRGLNQQRKAAIRDSEDITQQMIAQIMVATTLSLSRNSLIDPNLR
jgi:DNA excision repair protein ERCC-5